MKIKYKKIESAYKKYNHLIDKKFSYNGTFGDDDVGYKNTDISNRLKGFGDKEEIVLFFKYEDDDGIYKNGYIFPNKNEMMKFLITYSYSDKYPDLTNFDPGIIGLTSRKQLHVNMSDVGVANF